MLKRIKTWWAERAKSPILAAMPTEAEYPTSEEINFDASLNRYLAEKLAARLSADYARAQQVSAEVSKWLLTTLAAVNSGGVIASAQIAADPTFKIGSGTLFLLGLLLALLTGYASTVSGIKLGAPLGKMIGYWEGVAYDGERDREQELELITLGELAASRLRASNFLGASSFACFAFGCVVAGAGLLRHL